MIKSFFRLILLFWKEKKGSQKEDRALISKLKYSNEILKKCLGDLYSDVSPFNKCRITECIARAEIEMEEI